MNQLLRALVLLVATSAAAQNMPAELLGKWVIRRVISTSTISCWGDKEAKGIIGSEIEYAADSFRWKAATVNHPVADVAVLTAEQFHERYSGQGANSSQVSFRQLGIRTAKVKQVTIKHPPAEIPGDVVLLKDHNTIILSVCDVYFEAKRLSR